MCKNIVVLVLTLVVAEAFAQPYTPNGLWTYVRNPDVPAYANRDPQYIAGVLGQYQEAGTYWPEIRQVYRIYYHPERIDLDTANYYVVDVPRDLGVSELLTFARGYTDTSAVPTSFFWGGYTAHSDSLFYNEATVGVNRNIRPDTGYFGEMKFSPGYYHHVNGPPGARKWGYFIQFVDPIYHPKIVATDDVDAQAIARLYPNPTNELLQLTLQGPARWSDATASVYTFSGQLVLATPLKVQGLRGELSVAALPPGMYVLALRGGGSPVATTTFTKL